VTHNQSLLAKTLIEEKKRNYDVLLGRFRREITFQAFLRGENALVAPGYDVREAAAEKLTDQSALAKIAMMDTMYKVVPQRKRLMIRPAVKIAIEDKESIVDALLSRTQ